ncbi:MAG: NACHT domain-containing protein [Candidatus Magnetominusculus sp. LBB02]|nr:NACHT domain-containing protein [Candidatus Magnetominusculus sp. LBB02]
MAAVLLILTKNTDNRYIKIAYLIIPSIFIATLFLPEAGYWNNLLDLISTACETINQTKLAEYILSFKSSPLAKHTCHIILFIALTALILVDYLISFFDKANKPNSIDDDLPERDFNQRRDSFCDLLRYQLNAIDRETNWSDQFFTPLEVEVEVDYGTKKRKKVMELLNAVREDKKTKVFLVLGDPGAGKSVALRKLCKELSQPTEVHRTGRIPIYINLREWSIKESWTRDNPPTVEQLYNFVVKNLKDRSDVYANDFIDIYFKRLFDNGHFFIVLDSFDEIPAVLDVEESSWLIDKLSEIIFTFLSGAHASRGILSSRMFRRPTSKFQANTTLEIRPFTEPKIIENLKKSLHYNAALEKQLFSERRDLIPTARNPFTAALIINYAKEHNNALPENQTELYDAFIRSRLSKCGEILSSKSLTMDDVLNHSTEIAFTMFKTPTFGLEASKKELKELLPEVPVGDIVEIMEYARLGRVGAGTGKLFSFAHRRLNEYFLVLRFLNRPDELPIDSIFTDSRWRDALVLYCEVGDEATVRGIANRCWSKIERLKDSPLDPSNPQSLVAVHSLRFLNDAFYRRPDCISAFRSDLSVFVKYQIENSKNILAKKLAVEAVGLLNDNDLEAAILIAMKLGNPWINEISLKSCRHLPKISSELKDRIIEYIHSIDIVEFYKIRRELMFSLSLSDGFRNVKTHCKFIYYDLILLLIGISGLTVFHPEIIIIYGMLLILSRRPINSSFAAHYGTFTTTFISRLNVLLFTYSFISDKSSLSIVSYIWNYHVKLFYPDGYNISTISAYISFSDKCSLLFVIAMLPYFGIYLVIRTIYVDVRNNDMRKIFTMLRSKTIPIALITTSISVMVIVVIYVVKYLTPYIDQHTKLFLSIFALLVGLALIIWFSIIFSESKRYKAVIVNHPYNRQYIAESIGKFSTDEGRLKYIMFIKNSGVKPIGEWPNGEMPNFNDAASTILAQLEEKWLGLDR